MSNQIGMLLIMASVTLFSCHNNTHKEAPQLGDFPGFRKDMVSSLLPTPPEKPAFYISGTYVLTDQDDFCMTWDTIWVSKKPSEVNSYNVRRKTVFQRSVGERIFPLECYHQSWTGSYNAGAEKMEALTEARELQVNANKTGVELDGNFYKKVE